MTDDTAVPLASLHIAAKFTFLTLPDKIRTRNYDFLFTTPSSKQEISLIKADPPSSALIRTCKQLHEEAEDQFVEALRSYWREPIFFVMIHEHTDPAMTAEMKQDALDAVAPLREWVLKAMTLHNRSRSLVNPNINPCTDFFSHDRNLWFSMLAEDEPFEFPFLLIPGGNHTKVGNDTGMPVRRYGDDLEVWQVICRGATEKRMAWEWEVAGELDSLMTETLCIIRATF